MKRFTQYLIEKLHEETLNPRRQDYATQEEYLQALRDTSVKQKAEAQQMTSDAESKANILGKVETGLKVADTVTDAALSAGAVAVPGVGTALNAAVKGTKALVNANQGNYGQAALNVADAALPGVGRLANTASTAGKLANAVKPTAQLAADIGNYVANPVKTVVGTVAKSALGTNTGKAITTGVSTLGQSIGLSNVGLNVLGQTSLKTGTKLSAQPINNQVNQIKQNLS